LDLAGLVDASNLSEDEHEALEEARRFEIQLADLHVDCSADLEQTRWLVRFEVEQTMLDANEALVLEMSENLGS
jgi:hypothetical protein